jgi:hypothetical protein
MGAIQTGAEMVATLCCSVVAGAAVYITLVEHPGRSERSERPGPSRLSGRTVLAGTMCGRFSLCTLLRIWGSNST